MRKSIHSLMCKLCFILSHYEDSPRKQKIDHLRSQVNRLEHNLDTLLDMSIYTQRVVDQKIALIKKLEMQRAEFNSNGDDARK